MKPGALATVFGVSGYSGAGTVMETDIAGKPVSKPKIPPEMLKGGIKPYSLTGHIHEREAGYHLSSLVEGQVKVAFIPTVAPWFSGIITTASIPLKEKLSAKDILDLFQEKYKNEPLIRIQKDVVGLDDVEGRHGWSVGGIQTSVEGDRVVIVVCLLSEHPLKLAVQFNSFQGGLDNLLKGAATQCLQVGPKLFIL